MAELTPEHWKWLEDIAANYAGFDLRYEADDDGFKALDELVKMGLAEFHEDEKLNYNVWYTLTAKGADTLATRKK